MAKITKIEVQLGISIDKDGVWIKPSLGLSLDLDNQDSDPGNRSEIIEKAFRIVGDELNKELGRLLEEDKDV